MSAWTQILRFWSFDDPSIRSAVAGMLLLAVSCGSLGCFIVLRRLSLMGDGLGHSVLPGICLGFLVTGTKDLRWIFAGAAIAALVASWLIGVIQRYTRLKADVALGLVLSGFFGVGLMLLARLSKTAGGSQAGLKQFLFGQIVGIDGKDLWLMGGISVVIVAGVTALFKELAVTSFDEGFAASIGIPTRRMHTLLMSLTALAIVISLQAVGVVLLSALLITPAATALLLTDRLKTMVLLSVSLSAAGGLLGLSLSFTEDNLPTGPFVVLVLSLFFVAAYLFSPRYGVVVRRFRRRRRALRTQRENILKRIYQEIASSTAAAPTSVMSIKQTNLADSLGFSPASMRTRLRPLARHGWVELSADEVRLTEQGIGRARELDRNYRLWELFLTHEVRLPADHTARDAEDIEHLLTPELVRELEESYPQANPNAD